jgi:hypothetical protein
MRAWLLSVTMVVSALVAVGGLTALQASPALADATVSVVPASPRSVLVTNSCPASASISVQLRPSGGVDVIAASEVGQTGLSELVFGLPPFALPPPGGIGSPWALVVGCDPFLATNSGACFLLTLAVNGEITSISKGCPDLASGPLPGLPDPTVPATNPPTSTIPTTGLPPTL